MEQGETKESLKAKVQALEAKAYVQAVDKLAAQIETMHKVHAYLASRKIEREGEELVQLLPIKV